MNSKICLSSLFPHFNNKICLSSLFLMSLLLCGCVATTESTSRQPKPSEVEIAPAKPSRPQENKAVLSEKERRELQQELAAAQKKLKAAEAELKAMLEHE